MLYNRYQINKTTSNLKCQKISNTSDTLTYLPSASQSDMSVYFKQESSQSQLFYCTLSHNNIEWLQNQLQHVREQACKHYLCAQSEQNRNNYRQNLQQLSENISENMQRICEQRKRIKTKFINYLLLKLKQKNKKYIKKSNISKYRQLLLTIKQLTNNDKRSQKQIINLKQKLKTSGLFLVPSLIEKFLINLVFQSICTKNKPVIITDKSHLRLLIDFFMQNQETQNKLFANYQKQSNHMLYNKFKIYILLKTYIDSKISNHQLDQYCQNKITQYYQINLCRITETQLLKVRSLVQYDTVVHQYFNFQSIFHIQQMFKQIMRFVSKINNFRIFINQKIVQQIVKINKKVKDLTSITVPVNLLEQLCREDQVCIELVSYIIQFVQDRQNLKLPFKLSQLKKLLLLQSLKCLLIPLLKLLIEVNSIIYKDQKQRHYQNTRIIQKYNNTWNALLGQQEKLKQSRLKAAIQQSLIYLKSILQNKCEQAINWSNQSQKSISKSISKSKKQNKDNKNSKNEGSITISQLIIEYNQHFGQLYLYLANKISALNDNKSYHLAIQNFLGIWASLICQAIVQNTSCLKQMKNITFLHNQIKATLQNKIKINKQVTILHQLLLNENIPKQQIIKLDQQQIEQVYGKILQYNLRSSHYTKLMNLCKLIEIQDQIKQMNEQLYRQTFKKISV